MSNGLQNNKSSLNVNSIVSPTSTHDKLSSSVPIVTVITRGSHICSHQGIGDHCKKENHTRRQTQAKRVSQSKKIFIIQLSMQFKIKNTSIIQACDNKQQDSKTQFIRIHIIGRIHHMFALVVASTALQSHCQ